MLQIKNTEICGLTWSVIASGNPMVVGDVDTWDGIDFVFVIMI